MCLSPCDRLKWLHGCHQTLHCGLVGTVWELQNGLHVIWWWKSFKLCFSGLQMLRIKKYSSQFTNTHGLHNVRITSISWPYLQARGAQRHARRVSGSSDLPRVYNTKFGTVVTETRLSSGKKSPVVAVLGWNGSRQKHLAKYSAIFEEKGFSTICVPANPFDTFFRSGSKVKRIGVHVLDTLFELASEERPVFLYAFSNGGCAVFYHINELLNTPNQPFYKAFTVAGTIFDSCPIDPNIKSVRIVQRSVTDAIKNPFVRPLVWGTLGITVPFIVYFSGTVKKFMPALTSSPSRCPQLVFYSKADRFAPCKDIEKYVHAREDLGVMVTAKCWENSGHVNHYREHKEEYLRLLHTFIDKCLVPTL